MRDSWKFVAGMEESKKVMIVFGTRLEAIKMSPLVVALRAADGIGESLCSTGQHREMLAQVFTLFELEPDYDLEIMAHGQDLTDVTSAILLRLRELFSKFKPDRNLFYCDTNTALSASLAAHYARILVAHVEAGLRTFDLYSPWPEEGNRRLTFAVVWLINLIFSIRAKSWCS